MSATENSVDANSKLIHDIKLGRPLDYSFKSLRTLSKLGDEKPRSLRVRGVPDRGPQKKFICGAIWLNNNNLTILNGLKSFVDDLIELPMHLSWLDLSFNEFARVDEEILYFKNLRILYLHGNHLKDLREVAKLKELPNLRSLTLYGNLVSRICHYRGYVLAYLPQISSLDFTKITRQERLAVTPAGTNQEILASF
ncbi:leucine-rich repeat-containing protein 51-like [Adelges cooleyi]|uniref:leucine-rich repeat-containing protein 51-like n=1 Tax=Adelges cooleyi TaxID=133065 RepID=UPI00217F48A2|nr:leucine-rich repeat-containing protein 51-like [Adelges cooleyi]